ncbi:MAG: glycosyltransferase family 4 protein [Candidatus Pacebacteria bacterium]|nr:glycosyltransferase family 4 protein [Candidatus Paceibacterota bacterium]
MNLLILSYYYPPDLSAGSFRCQALVAALIQKMPSGSTITVLTTEPNRYTSHRAAASERESATTERGVTVEIIRFKLPPHHSRALHQALGFLAYGRQVVGWLKQQKNRGKNHDKVFATSSRLQTAFLGALVARLYRLPLVLELRDLFVENLHSLFAPPLRFFLLPIFKMMEAWTLRQASLLSVVTPAFADHYRRMRPNLPIIVIENGVDSKFLTTDFAKPPPAVGTKIRVVYAGNIGEGQGLERVLPELARARLFSHQFIIIGDGGRAVALAEATVQLPNVEFLPPLPRRLLLDHYRAADVLFLHLNDYASLQSVIPSKIFEYAATGKFIVAGVSGMASRIVRGLAGVVVFDPCDAIGGLKAIDQASLALYDYRDSRREFLARYDRATLMEQLASEIVGGGGILMLSGFAFILLPTLP